jgi:hypothetical protein
MDEGIAAVLLEGKEPIQVLDSLEGNNLKDQVFGVKCWKKFVVAQKIRKLHEK